MNTQPSDPRRDDEIDALLARQYRDTTPEFEARWVALKRTLRESPVPRPRRAWPLWANWVALGAVTAALIVVALSPWRQPPASEPPFAELSPALAELLAMDAVLVRGTALLDAENRDALLHLPAPAHAPL